MKDGIRIGRLLLPILGLWLLPIAAAERPRRYRETPMKATAYAQHGRTASGAWTRRGMLAADPRVLPLGTIVKVSNAGRYSGRYVVKDTGRKIKGRKIDVFVPSHREARKFGKRDVTVTVVQRARKR